MPINTGGVSFNESMASAKKGIKEMLLPKGLRARPLDRIPPITIVVHGDPVPAGRPRFTRTGHAYDPKKSHVYKRMVTQEAKLQYKGPMLEHKALRVEIKVYRPIQTSISKLKHKRRAEGLERPIVKPDTSNYVKLIEDALTGVIWEDDNLIADLTASKYYSDDPRIEVTVTEAGV